MTKQKRKEIDDIHCQSCMFDPNEPDAWEPKIPAEFE